MRDYNKCKELKTYRRIIVIITIITIIYTLMYGYCLYGSNIPQNITIKVDKAGVFSSRLPLTVDFTKDSIGVISVNNRVSSKESTKFTLSDNFSLQSSRVGDYSADIKAFGIIKLKRINVKVIEDKELVAGGIPIGIYIETDGLLVLGTGKVKQLDGTYVSPAKGLVKAGDYITAINGKKVANKYEFINTLSNIEDDSVVLKLRRNKKNLEVTIKCVKSSDIDNSVQNKLGIWVRNDMQGIGTLSYYDRETNTYGALGHGINDIDTNTLMNIKNGAIFSADIVDVIKGMSGKPGELVGVINYNSIYQLGSLLKNTNCGIFGEMDSVREKRVLSKISKDNLRDKYKICLKQDIKLGKAFLRCQVDNKIKDYQVYIRSINLNSRNNKSFVIDIIDKELIGKTNGIVQGMSGSPIIQNNKIVGALTHVFVKDSCKGYGVFIENMLKK